MGAISISKTTALTLQKEQLIEMQYEIGRYTEMTSHIILTHTDHEIVALGDLLSTELKALKARVENMFLTPNQSSEIHVSPTHVLRISPYSVIHVMDSSPSPSQSTWPSVLVAKL